MRWATGRRWQAINCRGGIELRWLAAADHDLKPLKASGFTQQQHLHQAADAIAAFMAQRLPAAP